MQMMDQDKNFNAKQIPADLIIMILNISATLQMEVVVSQFLVDSQLVQLFKKRELCFKKIESAHPEVEKPIEFYKRPEMTGRSNLYDTLKFANSDNHFFDVRVDSGTIFNSMIVTTCGFRGKIVIHVESLEQFVMEV